MKMMEGRILCVRSLGGRGDRWGVEDSGGSGAGTGGPALLACGWVLTEWWWECQLPTTPAGTLEHPLQGT